MRIIGEFPHKDCKITIFAWNNKFLIKLEKGFLEQTFKVNEFDITGDEDLHQILNEEFINEALLRFDDMQKSLGKSMENLY
jgi:hypothetical protein